ncbi:MAG: alpha/beta hydrolase-fold protein [Candidatus Aminicenantales bacterium]
MKRVFGGTAIRWAASLLLFWLLAGVPSVGFGQEGPGTAWVTVTIDSRALGQRTIYIATPDGYNEGTSRYPIMVMLDANDHALFRLWIAQAAYLTDNPSNIPPVIAVGIVNGSDRIHDMTPPATGSSVKDFKTAGGAAAFADFIINEVLPRVRARYRTLPSVFLTGHSAGGLFALDVAARRPSAFQGIIATSPAIWFNDESLVGVYADLLGRSPAHPRLFFSSGGDETDLSTATQHFAEQLGANPSLGGTFSYHTYPEASHKLTPMSFGDGLRFIFEPVSTSHLAIEGLDYANVDAAALNVALQSSEKAYAAGARSLGLSEQLPEQLLNDLGYRLINHKKFALAISVFERNVKAYPHSVNVYDSLADGFLAAADTVSALAQLRTAVQVAHRMGVPVPAETQKKLEALEARK